MTLETFYDFLTKNSAPLIIGLLIAPFIAWFLCYLIPGRREEPILLSVNLTLALIVTALWTGYILYALNTSGIQQIVKQANLFLLLLPPYYLITSLLLSRQRMPLNQIPAFRTLQGLMILLVVYFFLTWLGQRIYIVFFSRVPFSAFLLMLAIVLLAAYLGYRRVFGKRPRRR